MKKVNIKDVARQAGVSIATVSRVVNENYRVNPILQKHVRRVIARLGYYPNSIARSLKHSSTFTIGFVVFSISNTYFMTMAKSMEDVVSPENYSLIVCSTEGDSERELLVLRNLASKKIDGLIITTSGANDKAIVDLSKSIPTVLVHRRLRRPGFVGDFVDSNNIYGALTLTRHLIEAGHRDIGIINGPLKLSSAMERYQGYKKALRQAGIPLDRTYVYNGDYSFESGRRGMEKVIGSRPRPTAVVVMSHEMTLGALYYLRSHEVAVPKELSLVAYGNIENIDLLYIMPTIVTQDPEVLGSSCARSLLERIKDKTMPYREFICQPHLVPGNSVRSLKQRP